MGLYDTLELPAELVLPGLDRDPSTIGWQTKSIGRPAMRTFRITPDGRLLEEEFHTEEERPHYGTEKWDEPVLRMAGSFRHVHDGWMERPYHGVIRFTASVDGTLLAYEAKFTDGRLVALRDASEDTGEWLPADTFGITNTTGSTARRARANTSGPGCECTESGDTPAYKRTATSVHTVIRIGRLLQRMPDDKRDRDENPDDEQRQQPARKREDVRDHAHEDRAMSGDPGGRLGELDEALEARDYPITTDELVEAYGDYELETQGGTKSLEEVLAQTDNQTYESADDVRSRLLGLIHR